jgi:hypothetical protein
MDAKRKMKNERPKKKRRGRTHAKKKYNATHLPTNNSSMHPFIHLVTNSLSDSL